MAEVKAAQPAFKEWETERNRPRVQNSEVLQTTAEVRADSAHF